MRIKLFFYKLTMLHMTSAGFTTWVKLKIARPRYAKISVSEMKGKKSN